MDGDLGSLSFFDEKDTRLRRLARLLGVEGETGVFGLAMPNDVEGIDGAASSEQQFHRPLV